VSFSLEYISLPSPVKQRRKMIKLEVLQKTSAQAFSSFLSKFQILSCQSNFQEVDFYFNLGKTEQ